jgi:hypothetical protein
MVVTIIAFFAEAVITISRQIKTAVLYQPEGHHSQKKPCGHHRLHNFGGKKNVHR